MTITPAQRPAKLTSQQREFRRLAALAYRHRWAQPGPNDLHGPEAWMAYWRAMEQAYAALEKDPTARVPRPISPHTVGIPRELDHFERAVLINRSRELWEGYRP